MALAEQTNSSNAHWFLGEIFGKTFDDESSENVHYYCRHIQDVLTADRERRQLGLVL